MLRSIRILNPGAGDRSFPAPHPKAHMTLLAVRDAFHPGKYLDVLYCGVGMLVPIWVIRMGLN